MFKPNPIQKLYPNLQFHKIVPTEHTLIQPTKRSNSEPPVQTKPPITEKVTVTKEKTPIKEKKKVEIREPTPPKSPIKEEPVKTPEKPKEKVKRPNRVKPDPKPEPKRKTTIPQKGERGLQQKYSTEQRKDMYLNKLSRKSIKNAEKEINKINEIMEQVDGDHERLLQEEKNLKSRLKLINTAKLFTTDSIESGPTDKKIENNINNINEISENKEVLSEKECDSVYEEGDE
jgi:hypothetical protein